MQVSLSVPTAPLRFQRGYSPRWERFVVADPFPMRANAAGFVFPMCLEFGTAVVGAKAESGNEVKIYSAAEKAEICSDVGSLLTIGDAEKVGARCPCPPHLRTQ